MAMTFYAGGDPGNPTFEIDVSDPGYGRLAIRRHDDRYPGDDGNRWGDDRPLFAGPELGHLLKMVLNFATGVDTTPTVCSTRTRSDRLSDQQRPRGQWA